MICENCGAEVAHEKEHRHKLHWECPEPDWRTRALAAEEQHAHARNENAMLREQLAVTLSERNQAMRERDEANHAYDLVSVLIPGAVETAKERDRLRADNDLLTVERNAEQRKLGTAEEQLAHARNAERLTREALQVAMRERDEARATNLLNRQALANEKAARASLTADLAEMTAAWEQASKESAGLREKLRTTEYDLAMARDWLATAQDENEEFQEALGINVGGDPGGVEPRHVREYVQHADAVYQAAAGTIARGSVDEALVEAVKAYTAKYPEE